MSVAIGLRTVGSGELVADAAPIGRVAILTFPNLASAMAGHESAESQKILLLRTAAATSHVYIVKGIAT